MLENQNCVFSMIYKINLLRDQVLSPMAPPSPRKRRFIDETGKRYGRLLVLRFDEVRNGQAYFVCQCECGSQVSVKGANLRSKNTTTCGCSHRKKASNHRGKMAMRRFGHHLVFGKIDPQAPKRKTRWAVGCYYCCRLSPQTEHKIRSGKLICKCLVSTRTSWRRMIDRCTNPKHPYFHKYGGAGITVCEQWRDSFLNFLEDMGRRPEGKTIDRYPNPLGTYKPSNCRWATKKEQAQNRRMRVAPVLD